jgi:general secretion pathway protein N
MSRPLLRTAAVLAVALAAAVAVLLTMAPAALLAGAARTWSQGHLELSEPAGTLWNGDAQVLLAAGDGGAQERMAVAGRTSWHISPWRLLTGTLDLGLNSPGALEGPLTIRVDRSGNATIESGRLHLPAALLVALGAPWNTIRPGGELELEWDTLHVAAGQLHGPLRAQWTGASSSLSPVVPFGHYRLRADGVFDGAQVVLETVAGPMEMSGNGTIANGGQLHFRGAARVQPGTDAAVATQLAGLISLLGRRDGDGAILSFGS